MDGLREQGIISVAHINDLANTTFISQNGLDANTLGIVEVEHKQAWERYIKELKDNHIRLKDNEDIIVWSRNPYGGTNLPKPGYEVIREEEEVIEIHW